MPIRNPVQVPQPLTVAEVVVAAVVEPSPPQTRAELLAAIADPKRKFGLLPTAPSMLLAPAFRALDNFCQAKSMPLPDIACAREGTATAQGVLHRQGEPPDSMSPLELKYKPLAHFHPCWPPVVLSTCISPA